MSVLDALDAFDKLEFNDFRAFNAATTLIGKSLQEFRADPSGQTDPLKYVYETE